MEALHELERQRSPAREPPSAGLRGEKVEEGAVGSALGIEAAHDEVELLPEVVHAREPAALGAPALAGDIARGEARFPDDLRSLRRAPVYELGAELDRQRNPGVAERQHASADAIARLEEQHRQPRRAKLASGGQASNAGAHQN